MSANKLFDRKKSKPSKYRNQIHTLGDILDVIMDGGQEGVIISSISRRANLSHYPAKEKCNKLLSAGLVESKIDKCKNVFVLTEKGFNFIQEYRKFQDFTESFNLKY